MDTVLVLGAEGMLGSMMVAELRARGHKVRAPERTDFDARVDDPAPLLAGDPGWVVNAIGLLKGRIDEDDPAAVDTAFAVNGRFPQQLARAAGDAGWRVVHITTDAVFSGAEGAPYDERAPHDATNVYGQSKSLGEVEAAHVLNLRCSIIGPERGGGRSLLAWVLGQPHGARIEGYDNQRWNGVTTLHLARLVHAAIVGVGASLPGTLHVVPADDVSKAELVALIAQTLGRDDLEVAVVDGPRATDLRLATIHPREEAALWRRAGYPARPSIAAMLEELAAIVPGRSWPPTTS